MKTNLQRAAATLLACLLLLSSCGETVQTENPDTKRTETTAITEAPETDILDSLGEIDYGGADFRIICQHMELRPNMPLEAETGDLFWDSIYRRDRRIEEQFGVKMVYSADGNRGAVRDAVTRVVNAQEDAYDIVLTPMSDGFNVLVPAGMLYDLRTVDTLCLEEPWWNQSMNREMTIGGKQYAATGMVSVSYLYTPYYFLFNMNIASDYNISSEQLYSAVREGSWTLEMMEMLQKDVYSDLDSNGKEDITDQYGLMFDEGCGNAFYAGCGMLMVENDDGEIKINMNSEKSIGVLDRLNSMFSEGSHIRNDTMALGNDSDGVPHYVSSFMKGRVLFNVSSPTAMVTYLRDMEDDYGMLPMPKLDEAQADYFTIYNSWMPSGYGIPITATETGRIGVISETMARLGYTTVQPNFVEVTMKEKVARDENSKEMLDYIMNSLVIDLNMIFNFGNSSIELRKYAAGLTENFASKYEKLTKVITKDIDKLLEQYNSIDG
ncbi:MAG: hypothetical protein IJA85_00640 [Clostridia bacterium]|nr:hypothetical protein [Clostridia bacterium]